MKYINWILILLLITLPSYADSLTMRCGTNLINVGERNFEVIRKCGDPDYKNFVGYAGGYNSYGGIPIEEWVYNQSLGSTHSYNLLRFEGGKLVQITFNFSTN